MLLFKHAESVRNPEPELWESQSSKGTVQFSKWADDELAVEEEVKQRPKEDLLDMVPVKVNWL